MPGGSPRGERECGKENLGMKRIPGNGPLWRKKSSLPYPQVYPSSFLRRASIVFLKDTSSLTFFSIFFTAYMTVV
jgi:hypothetical protein